MSKASMGTDSHSFKGEFFVPSDYKHHTFEVFIYKYQQTPQPTGILHITFDSTDKLFLPIKKGISPQSILLVDAVFYPTALKGCRGIVFTHGVWMGERAGGRSVGRAAGNSVSGLYLRNRKV